MNRARRWRSVAGKLFHGTVQSLMIGFSEEQSHDPSKNLQLLRISDSIFVSNDFWEETWKSALGASAMTLSIWKVLCWHIRFEKLMRLQFLHTFCQLGYFTVHIFVFGVISLLELSNMNGIYTWRSSSHVVVHGVLSLATDQPPFNKWWTYLSIWTISWSCWDLYDLVKEILFLK